VDSIKYGKKPKNPLLKRVWRDIVSDWKRYLMIFAVLTITIGFVSGMYVANNSMERSMKDNETKMNLESGHFELSRPIGNDVISSLENGERADVVSGMREKAYSEADGETEQAVRSEFEKQAGEQVKEIISSQATALAEQEIEKSGKKLSDSEKNSIIESAVEKALSEQYERALDDALNELWKSDEYENALNDAVSKVHESIDSEIDEKYSELSERYGLDDDFVPVNTEIYELFWKFSEENTDDEDYSGKIRVYSERNEIDLYDVMKGSPPQNSSEIMIDRMHAENAGIEVGDTISVGSTEFTVSGFASFVDYTTLYENNTDTMFDALTFDVAMVTKQGFDRISEPLHYNYAFKYSKAPSDIYEEKLMSDSFLNVLITQTAVCSKSTEIKDYVPKYANHSVTFAPDDMGSDKSMGGVLLYILTAVIAFIFAVTEVTALEKESSVIGTLRASGYTRGELTAYYMSMPVITVILASLVGNILGYTCMKYIVISMYYNSYSLPSYHTIWTPDAFVRTTVIPFIIVIVVNFIVISRTLKLPPLNFLRHSLKKAKNKKAVRLPRVKFFSRFRIRVFLQNIPNYLMMLTGTCFIMLLLSMAVGMPETLSYYQNALPNMMFAPEQAILSDYKDSDGNIIQTENESAEPFSVASLVRKSDAKDEEVSVYGIFPESTHIHCNFPESDEPQVFVSESFSRKYGIKEGDRIVLEEKYENKSYEWNVCGIYDYSAGIAVFMPNDTFNSVFERKKDSFSGYMADSPIDDIDSKYIVKTINASDMTKMADQLDHSMGSYMKYFQYVCVIVSAIPLCLLTKIIIEKNERSISMAKILGYTDSEIARLYLTPTFAVIVVSELIALFAGYEAMRVMWDMILMKIDGYFAFVLSPSGFVKEFVLVLVSYLIIAVLNFIRIKNVPKVLALKNMM